MPVDGKWLLVAGIIGVAVVLEAAIFTFIMPLGSPGPATVATDTPR